MTQPQVPTPGCILITGNDLRVRQLVAEAASLELPGMELTSVDDVAAALRAGQDGRQGVLVMVNPTPDDTALALRHTDSKGFAQWAIVVFGTVADCADVELLSPAETDVRLVSRAFRAALAKYGIVRNHARLVGDLRTLARRVSHDLRTPLGCVLSIGEALKVFLEENAPSELPLADSLLEAAEELSQLIERVNFVLRATADPPPLESFGMGEPVFNALQRLEGRLLRARVSVHSPEEWPEVRGVASWSETVWWNLISNVVRHGREVSQIQLGWERRPNHFRFWVMDDGQGVDEEIREKLFLPFDQLHLAMAAHGWGLPIVERLVTLQKGACGYEPQFNGAASGSLFYFTLPIEACVPQH